MHCAGLHEFQILTQYMLVIGGALLKNHLVMNCHLEPLTSPHD